MHRDALVALAVGEEVVDADRVAALEGVVGGGHAELVLEPAEVRGELVGLVGVRTPSITV